MRLSAADAVDLDRLASAESDVSLLQSWHWGEFQRAAGRTVERFGIRRPSSAGPGELIAAATVVRHTLPLGLSYAYLPRGPIVAGQRAGKPDADALKQLIEEITVDARSWGAVFIRIDPAVPPAQAPAYAALGFKPAVSQIQPHVSARLDLTQGRDKILAGMKQKTRYNVRLAAKKNVAVQESIRPEDIEAFIALNRETTARDKFVSHEDDYYRTQLAALGPAGLLKLFTATYEGRTLAVIVVGLHGTTATYLHGASSDRDRNLMAAYAVQWEAIKAAERLGLHWYDFHGVAPTDDDKHPWAGITRFKLSFGAQREPYVGALDLPLRSVPYTIYSARLRLRGADVR